MSPSLKTWKDKMTEHADEQSEFEMWVFVEASGVVVGEKTGELLMLCPDLSGLDIDRRLECIDRLCTQWGLDSFVLCRCDVSAKVIIYDRDRLQRDLNLVPVWVFDRLGYSPNRAPRDFLEQISHRWQTSGKIPHEIGLCLGYPLKDVLGFMGLLNLPCTGHCGWRVFGRPEDSLRRSRRYRQARHEAQKFIRENKAA